MTSKLWKSNDHTARERKGQSNLSTSVSLCISSGSEDWISELKLYLFNLHSQISWGYVHVSCCYVIRCAMQKLSPIWSKLREKKQIQKFGTKRQTKEQTESDIKISLKVSLLVIFWVDSDLKTFFVMLWFSLAKKVWLNFWLTFFCLSVNNKTDFNCSPTFGKKDLGDTSLNKS